MRCVLVFFFFKQKTAYEMRISDWSSDVCSSDLAPVGSDEDRKWIEREDRLRRIILNPSLIIVWVFGLMLAFNGDYWREGWFIAKLLLVVALSGYHGWMIGSFKKLKQAERRLIEKRPRMFNEVLGEPGGDTDD